MGDDSPVPADRNFATLKEVLQLQVSAYALACFGFALTVLGLALGCGVVALTPGTATKFTWTTLAVVLGLAAAGLMALSALFHQILRFLRNATPETLPLFADFAPAEESIRKNRERRASAFQHTLIPAGMCCLALAGAARAVPAMACGLAALGSLALVAGLMTRQLARMHEGMRNLAFDTKVVLKKQQEASRARGRLAIDLIGARLTRLDPQDP